MRMLGGSCELLLSACVTSPFWLCIRVARLWLFCAHAARSFCLCDRVASPLLMFFGRPLPVCSELLPVWLLRSGRLPLAVPVQSSYGLLVARFVFVRLVGRPSGCCFWRSLPSAPLRRLVCDDPSSIPYVAVAPAPAATPVRP